MRVQVKLFARLRELCGSGEASLELPDGADAATCFTALADEHPGLAPYRDRVGVAVNEEYCGWDRKLEEGDVVAFIPPVSGGRGGPRRTRSRLPQPRAGEVDRRSR